MKRKLTEVFSRDSEITYKDKIFHYKLQNLYRVLLVLVLVGVIFFAVRVHLSNMTYDEFEVLSKMKKMGTTESIYETYQKDVLVHSKDGMSAYDYKGNQLWNQTYEMQSPIIRTYGEYVAAGDYQGSKIFVVNGTGKTNSIDTNLPILDLQVSNKGVVIATLEDDEIIWIKLYSFSGDEIAHIKTSMQKSGFPISFSISQDNIKLGVSYLKASAGKINSSVAFYNFGDVGQNETDNFASGYDYTDLIVPYLTFTSEDNAVAVGDNKLLIFKGKQKPALDVDMEIEENVQTVFSSDKYIGLVYPRTDGIAGYQVHVYNMNGKEILSHNLDFEYKDIIFDHERFIAYNESRTVIVGINQVVKYDGSLGGNVQTIIPMDARTKFMVVRDDSIEQIKLR